jgi:glycosyltransferase involved in cell wall biosynthesis
MPFFSVVIATRNRPILFESALESVLAQSCPDLEVIVVNDGSAAEHQSRYEAILSNVDPSRVRSFALAAQPQGHGASFVLNFGAAQAGAAYLCFLDDDDSWTDRDHLSRAREAITGSNTAVDLYMTNQAAFLNGERRAGPIWIEDLPMILGELGNRPDRNGAHDVSVEELIKSNGFCHLNTLIVRRALYQEIGGMEESIRWESDHDIYLRLIDRSNIVKYMPVTVARHNIPDPRKSENVTTRLSEIERRTFQLTVFERASLNSRNPSIRAYAQRHRAYTLKRLAEACASAGRHADAARYAREALRAGPTIKWAGYTVWRTMRGLGA